MSEEQRWCSEQVTPAFITYTTACNSNSCGHCGWGFTYGSNYNQSLRVIVLWCLLIGLQKDMKTWRFQYTSLVSFNLGVEFTSIATIGSQKHIEKDNKISTFLNKTKEKEEIRCITLGLWRVVEKHYWPMCDDASILHKHLSWLLEKCI